MGKTANIKRKVLKDELEQDLSATSEEELLSVDLGDRHDLSMNAVASVYQPKIFLAMEIEGKPDKMQVDSGASCSVLPEKSVLDGKDKLKSELKLLEDKGVISKVNESTDWVSSLLVTRKANGNVKCVLIPNH